jgi:hypothetical protein
MFDISTEANEIIIDMSTDDSMIMLDIAIGDTTYLNYKYPSIENRS